MPSDMPWQPRSRQEQGRQSEGRQLARRNAHKHPNSGAGRIKRDGSNETHLYELKDADRSHTVKGDDLLALFRQASAQGKEGVYVIHFRSAGITLEGFVHRETI